MSKPTSPPADDLDFTHADASQAPKVTPRQVEQAREEAKAVAPKLRESGFYVSIARRSAVRIPPKSGDKHVILAVEDDADLGQLLIDIFTLSGFEVRWASNRAEINAEMKRIPGPDLVLMDILLPDANGLDVLYRLRGHPKLAKLPVIMMTGKSDAKDVQAGLEAGADGYVSKPFKMSGLVHAVKSVLGIE